MQLRSPYQRSWNDGHSPDGRLTNVPIEYGMCSAYYIPRLCEDGFVSPSEVPNAAFVGLLWHISIK